MNDVAPNAAIGSRRAAEASPDVIARVLVEGFDRHYALFRECARAAKRYFEAGNWLAIGHVAGDRIDFYDRRVAETVSGSSATFVSVTPVAPTHSGRRSSSASSASSSSTGNPNAPRRFSTPSRRSFCIGRISTIAACSSGRPCPPNISLTARRPIDAITRAATVFAQR